MVESKSKEPVDIVVEVYHDKFPEKSPFDDLLFETDVSLPLNTPSARLPSKMTPDSASSAATQRTYPMTRSLTS